MTVSFFSTSIVMCFPSSSRGPGPTARTLPRCGFSWAVSGSTMPLAVVASSSRTSTIRRSPSGCRFIRVASLCYMGLIGGTCLWHSLQESANVLNLAQSRPCAKRDPPRAKQARGRALKRRSSASIVVHDAHLRAELLLADRRRPAPLGAQDGHDQARRQVAEV